ncbi:MAG: hypothetical protein QOJ98_1945 [Acidobacteriota bacterium]|nr:hypothetical protein [Acidobacteriota bacterium]
MSDWFSHMRRGDFTSAWAISDAILASRAGTPSWHLEREYQWIWGGTPLEGKRVLIRCYHGLGDTIQFARFFPIVSAIAKECTVWVQPSLIPLLQTMRGIGRLLPLHDGTPEVEFDVDVESMELTHVFRTTVDTIPHDVPYLHVAPATLPKRGIGVVWRAGDWGPQRSIPIDTLARLFDLPDVTFYSLQRGDSDPRLVTLDGVDEPLSTARLMRALDLVITVDTVTAHLAGALGVPVFTLLPYEHDWRWMDERRDSPWYPSMRLFRQPRPGDWESVVEEVRYAIATMSDETKKESLNDWGIDVDKFKERAKVSLETAKGDLSEISGTLRHALVHAKDVVLGLQTNGAPAAAELKSGFERAWKEIENAFRSARDRATGSGEPPVSEAPTEPPTPPSS